MKYEIKHADVEYIESGSYVGGEEEAWDLGIRTHTECVVMTKSELRKIQSVFRLIEKDDSGDFEFVKYQIKKIMEEKLQ